MENDFSLGSCPKAIIPFYLLVDHSNSTQPFIDDINKGIITMIESIKKSSSLAGCDIRFTLIPFEFTVPDPKIHKKSIEEVVIDEPLVAEGATNLGLALKKAFDLSTEEYQFFKITTNREKGQGLMHPVVILFTDGKPDGGFIKGEDPKDMAERERLVQKDFEEACQMARELVNADKASLLVYSFQYSEYGEAIENENVETLKKLVVNPEIQLCNINAFEGSNQAIDVSQMIQNFFADNITQHLKDATKSSTIKVIHPFRI